MSLGWPVTCGNYKGKNNYADSDRRVYPRECADEGGCCQRINLRSGGPAPMTVSVKNRRAAFMCVYVCV